LTFFLNERGVLRYISPVYSIEDMDLKKEDANKISVNLSPSSLNLYYQSPLLFYLTYLAKAPEDTPVPVCYGLSGQIIHSCLEKYAKREIDNAQTFLHLINEWGNKNLHVHKDVKGNVLDKEEYLKALAHGIRIVDQHENCICEESISLPFKENELMEIGLKGVIDLQAVEKESNQLVIIDYKTSNKVDKGEDFTRQALFYNLLIHKKKNVLPSKTNFHYLKLGQSKGYSFGLQDIENFYKELENVADQILSFGKVMERYPIGNVEGLFNSRKQACLKEIAKRKEFERLYKLTQL